MADPITVEHDLSAPSESLLSEAWDLLMQGFPPTTVAEQLGVTLRDVSRVVQMVVAECSPELTPAARRLLEGFQLDAAQSALWPSVLAGDVEAVDRFLKISDRRVKLWGLAPDNTRTHQAWVVRVVYGDDVPEHN